MYLNLVALWLTQESTAAANVFQMLLALCMHTLRVGNVDQWPQSLEAVHQSLKMIVW